MPQKNNKFIYQYLSVPIWYKALPFIVWTLEAFDAMQPYTTSKLNILIARNTILSYNYYRYVVAIQSLVNLRLCQ